MKKLPFYLLMSIFLFSIILHFILLMEHPGSNFVEPSIIELEQLVEQGEMTESVAKLKEHTWRYGSRDGYLYSKMANQLLEHRVYGYDTYNTDEIIQNAFVTPGHPLYLTAIFGVANVLTIDQVKLVKVVNMVLSISSVFLIFLITAKLFNHLWMGMVACSFYVFYFSPLHYFRTTLTEIPGIFIYLLAFYTFLWAYDTNKKGLHLLFAIVFCYAIMIRPVLAPVIVFAFLLVIIRNKANLKETAKIGLLWALGASMVVLPWVIRNGVLFQEFILFSTHSGNSWYNGANPFTVFDFRDYYKERMELGMEAKEYAQMKIKEGFQGDFGLWFAWFTVGKTYELFKLPDGIYHYSQHWSLSWFKLQHQILVILALITAFIVRKKEVLAVSIVLLSYIALSNLFLTIPRYGFYIIPVMCMLNGYAIVTIFSKVRTGVYHLFRL